MKISYDPVKRMRTQEECGLDCEDCVEVFGGPTLDLPDERRDYGEVRIMSAGLLRGRMVIVIRGATRGTSSR